MRIEKCDGNVETFIGFTRLFSDKTASTVKNTAMVACPVNAISLNILVRRMQWLAGSGHTLIGFLAVCFSEEQRNGEGSGENEKYSCIDLLL